MARTKKSEAPKAKKAHSKKVEEAPKPSRAKKSEGTESKPKVKKAHSKKVEEAPKPPRIKSRGQCCLCKQVLSRTSMTRHLDSCRKQASEKEKAKAQEVFYILVQHKYSRFYWLYLHVPGKATLKDLDGFLRDIWLECCGHLSMFTIEGCDYSASPQEDIFCSFIEFEAQEKSMDVAIREVLKPGMKIEYQYDFGSTTNLILQIISKNLMPFKGKKIQLLARNEEPPFLCDVCQKQKATKICAQCYYDFGGWLCSECAKEHECDEEMFLPVVNSPRTGVCGYEG